MTYFQLRTKVIKSKKVFMAFKTVYTQMVLQGISVSVKDPLPFGLND